MHERVRVYGSLGKHLDCMAMSHDSLGMRVNGSFMGNRWGKSDRVNEGTKVGLTMFPARYGHHGTVWVVC